MSKESAKQFVRRLLDDRDFLKRFASATGGDERRKKAKDEGFDFTTEELQEAKAEALAAGGAAARKPPGGGDVMPLYGVVDAWESS